MFERFGRKSMQATTAAMITALGVAGFAAAQSKPATSTTKARAAQVKEQSSSEVASKSDGPGGHADKPGANVENTDGARDSTNESGSEVAKSDGPGGHADKPGANVENTDGAKDSTNESGSEVASKSDGPGGPNTQQQGEH